MKTMKIILASVLFLSGVMASSTVLAHGHGHVRLGIFIGGPIFSPYYYPAPRYYYPPDYYYAPVVVAPAAPPVYVEQNVAPPAPQQSTANYWYYCAQSQTYYPYVQQCSGPWQRVSPQPPS